MTHLSLKETGGPSFAEYTSGVTTRGSAGPSSALQGSPGAERGDCGALNPPAQQTGFDSRHVIQASGSTGSLFILNGISYLCQVILLSVALGETLLQTRGQRMRAGLARAASWADVIQATGHDSNLKTYFGA